MDIEYFKTALRTADALRVLLAQANEENVALRIEVKVLRAQVDDRDRAGLLVTGKLRAMTQKLADVSMAFSDEKEALRARVVCEGHTDGVCLGHPPPPPVVASYTFERCDGLDGNFRDAVDGAEGPLCLGVHDLPDGRYRVEVYRLERPPLRSGALVLPDDDAERAP